MFLGNVFLELERTEHTGEARGAAGREADDNAERTPFLRNVGDLTLQGRVDLTENISVGLLAFRVVNVKNSLGRARWRERERQSPQRDV